ncbi:MAG TPA: glycosyltransferase family 1 protein [Thermoplasmata archaeon]|nr:glycosyltransferase family 1 protein [Thermoplasmata archaeon]
MPLRAQYPVTWVRAGQVDPRAKWFTAIYDEIRLHIPTHLIRLFYAPLPSLAPALCRLQMSVLERRDRITHIPTNAYHFLLRRRARCPTVISCYHVGPRKTMVPLELADRVLVSARQLIPGLEAFAKLPHPPEVVYLAVPPSYRPAEVPREPHQLLYVGTEQKRKNVEGLFRIFARVLKEHPATLVKIGKPGPERPRLSALARELGIQDHVVWRDYVPEEELVRLYQTSTLAVVPSFLEGFSMPCLEAMSTGCPLVASNLTAIPEIVGNGGLLISPNAEDEWADSILRILQEPAFARELAARGVQRSRDFSPQKSAEQTLRIYREVWQDWGGR